MQKKLTLTGANYVFFSFVVLFMLFQIVLTVFTLFFGQEFLNNNIYGILITNEYILILLPVLIYTLKNRLNFKEIFRFNRLSFLPAAIIVLISVPAYFVALMLNNAVVYFLQFIGNVPSQPIPVPETIPQLLVGIAVVAVSPAICEEMLHRGIMLKAYEKRGTMKAIVFTSIFFGLFHFDITNLLGPIFLGLLIGYYVIRTNSIFAGMLAHFLNNAIAELFQFYMGNNEQPDNITISGEEMASLVFYGVVGILVASLLIYFFKLVTEGNYSVRAPISTIKGDLTSVLSHWPIISIFALYMFITGIYLLSAIIGRMSGL